MTPELRLARFAADPSAIPARVLDNAARLIADTLKVGAAGAGTAEARAVARDGAGPSRLLTGGRCSAEAAAFANGFASHCLEWDAVHEEAVVHACSVVTAALLALADEHQITGERLRTAFVIGVEVAAGLGIEIPFTAPLDDWNRQWPIIIADRESGAF